jgi:dTDP-4-dehydrorhamnose reductase
MNTGRILICGVSGMIGHKLWEALAAEQEDVFGTVHGRRDAFRKYQLFDERVFEDFEASDFGAVTHLLDRLRPSLIINCIGITKRKQQADEVGPMFTINALFPHHLARWARSQGARVIQFSTDCVFDGAEGKYTERSVMTATDLYGQSKYFGELHYDHCLTIRTSMIGREIAGRTELLEWFLAQRGKRIKGFKNALYSGVTTLYMSQLLSRLLRQHSKLGGRYQIAGPAISKYDLLCQLREALQLDVEIEADETFRCDRTLQSEKFTRRTGIQVPSWKEMLLAVAQDRELYERGAT